jgi:hypothetical protein
MKMQYLLGLFVSVITVQFAHATIFEAINLAKYPELVVVGLTLRDVNGNEATVEKVIFRDDIEDVWIQKDIKYNEKVQLDVIVPQYPGMPISGPYVFDITTAKLSGITIWAHYGRYEPKAITDEMDYAKKPYRDIMARKTTDWRMTNLDNLNIPAYGPEKVQIIVYDGGRCNIVWSWKGEGHIIPLQGELY